ncbi:MAG: hypothetical protein ACLFUS_06155 [Candidatus Sumerlaeia bacterium]
MAAVDFSQLRNMIWSALQSSGSMTGAEGPVPHSAGGSTVSSGASASADAAQATQAAPETSQTRPPAQGVAISSDARQELAREILRILGESVGGNGRPVSKSGDGTLENPNRPSRQPFRSYASDTASSYRPAQTGRNYSSGPSSRTSQAVSSSDVATILADPALREQVVRLFSQPEVVESLPRFLQNPELQEVTLRLLAQPEMEQTMGRVFPNVSDEQVMELLAKSSTRASMTHIMAEQELTETSVRLLQSENNAPETLRHLVSSAEGRAVVARAMQASIEVQVRVFQAVESGQLSESVRADAARLFARSDVQSQAPDMLVRPDTASSFLRTMALPEMRQTTQTLLARPDVRAELAGLAMRSDTADATLQLMARHQADPAVRNFVQSPQGQEVLSTTIQMGTHPASTQAQVQNAARAIQLVTGENIAPPQPAPSREAPQSHANIDLARAREDLGQAARALFSRPEVQQRLSDLLANGNLRSLVWDAMAQPEMRDSLRPILADPETQVRFAEALQRGPGNSEAAKALRALARYSLSSTESANPAAIQNLLEMPEVRASLSRFLATPEHRGQVIDIITQAANRDSAGFILETPESRQAIRMMTTQAANHAQAARLLQLPEAARQVLTILAEPANAEAARQFMARTDVQQQMPALLADGATRDLALALIARNQGSPQNGPTIQMDRLLQNVDIESLAPQLLESSTGRAEMLQSLSRPEMVEMARAVFQQEAAVEALRAIFSPGAASSASSETSDALRMLAQADMSEIARQVFSTAESREALTQILRSGIRSGQPPSENAQQAMRILAQSDMGQVARQVFQSISQNSSGQSAEQIVRYFLDRPETRVFMVEILSRPEMAEISGRLLADSRTLQEALANFVETNRNGRLGVQVLSASPELARVVLETMATQNNSRALTDFVSRGDLQNIAARLIEQTPTREPFLRLMSRPGFSQQATRMLERPDVQRQLAAMVQDTSTATSALRFLNQPQFRELPLNFLANPESVESLLRIAGLRPDAGGPPASAEARQQALGLLSRPELAQVVSELWTGTANAQATETTTPSPRQAEFVDFLQQNATRSTALSFLSQPEMAEEARRFFQLSEARDALARGLQIANNSGTNQAQFDRAALELLARPEMTALRQDITQRPEMVQAFERMLANGETRAQALNVLTMPESTELARQIFAAPEAPETVLNLARSGSASEALSRVMQNPEVAREFFASLARPENAQTASQLLRTSTGQQTAARVLEMLPSSTASASAETVRQVETAQRDLMLVLSRPENAAHARQIFSSSSQLQARLAEMMQAPPSASPSATSGETRQLLMGILSRPEMADVARQVLAASNMNAETMARLIISAPASGQSETLIFLRQSADPAMLNQAALRPEVQANLSASLRTFLEQIGTQTPARGIQVGLQASPDPTLQQASEALRLLSRLPSGEAAQRLFQNAELQQMTPRLLHYAETRAPMLEILSKPEMAQIAARVMHTPEAGAALAQMIGRGANEAATVRLLQNAPAAQAIFTALAGAHSEEAAAAIRQFMSRPQIQAEAIRLLSSTSPESQGAREALMAVLSKSGLQTPAQSIVQSEGVMQQLPRLIQSSESRAAILEIVAQGESVFRGDMSRSLQAAMQRPESIEALRAIFTTNSANAPADSANPDQRSNAIRILAWPEMVEVSRQVFQQPEQRAALGRMLVESAALLQGGRPAASGAAPSQSPSLPPGAEPNLAAVMDLLSRPDMANTARQVFSFSETRTALADLLAAGPSTSGKGQRAQADSAAILRMLSHPEMAEAAREIFSRGDVQQRFSLFLSEAATRGPALEIMSNPELRDITSRLLDRPEVRRAFADAAFSARSETRFARLMDNPEMARILIDEMQRPERSQDALRVLSREDVQSRLSRMMTDPQAARLIMELMARPEMSRVAEQVVMRKEFLTQMLTMARDAESRELLRVVLDRREMRQALEMLVAGSRQARNYPPEARAFFLEMLNNVKGMEGTPAGKLPSDGRAALETISGSSTGILPASASLLEGLLQAGGLPASSISQASAGKIVQALLSQAGSIEEIQQSLPALLERLFGAEGRQPLSDELRGELENVIARMLDVSPTRGRQLLRSLALLADLGGQNLQDVLQKISMRTDQMASILAQKGGLPSILSEPLIGSGSLLMLQLGSLTTEQLSQSVRMMLSQGIDISLVGRDTRGNAQIHFQLAEQPLGSPERVMARIPGVPVSLANLSPAERQALSRYLPEYSLANYADTDAQVIMRRGASQRVTPQEIQVLANMRDAARSESSRVTRSLNLGPDVLATLRPEAGMQYAFNYYLAGLFPWFDFSATPTDEAAAAGMVDEEGNIIPTFLDLIAEEPLMLPHEPDPLIIPGTDIPLF